MAAMTKPELTELVGQLVKDCEDYRDQLSATRVRAMEYYDGVMADVPAEANRSKVVSRDVRAAVKKVLPSLIRTVLGNDKVVEYQPVNQGDEAGAEQATDYINYIVFPESDGYDAVQDAAHDALKLGNGVIRWWYEKRKRVEVSTHSGLDEAALVQLIADDTVEVLEQAQSVERIELPTGSVEQPVFAVKIRRTAERGATRLAAVPLEEFLVHPDAIAIDDSPIAGIKRRMRRSDLIAMGYDRDLVEGFAIAGNTDGEDEEFARRRGIFGDGQETAKALQEVDYYELYVKVDADDDGIAELRRLVFAGGTGADNLLEDAEWDEVPFADLITERRPHQREGNAITDDMAEIQRVKTVLLRQTLDNLYWQNNQQPIVQEGVIQNPESVLNPKFGQPIRVGQGVDVRGAVGYTAVPFVARESFSMLGYLDQEATDRTGISDASSGMAPDALQNMTAKATALVEQAGIGQTELMVRTFAQGLRRVFKGLLGLTIKHQDRPRAVRLRGKWVTFDPRHWNAGMDATVNTGLGAGTRERDMLMIQMIQQLQEKLLTTLGPDNPYVSPDNLYNGIAKTVEAAGLKSPDLYFTKPTPEDIQRRMNPQLERDRAALETQLANQGLQPGSEAYNRAIDQANRQANDARFGAILNAGQEQSRLAGLAQQAASFENSAQQQAYGQMLQSGQFANQAQNQQYTQNANNMQLANAAQLQNFNQALAAAGFSNDALQQMHQNSQSTTAANNTLKDQTFNAQQAQLAAQNAARAQYLNEMYAQRNQPINEISSLLSGAQVNSPNFVPTQGQRIEPVDYMGMVQNNYRGRLDAYQSQLGAGSNILGSVLGMPFWGGKSSSDRRLKKDIRKVGKFHGHSLYEYRYKDEPGRAPKHVGMMAQEVEKTRPDVVSRGPDGMRRVDYGRLFSVGQKRR